ncbi:MAG: hypothetical protein LBU03_01620 [Tannerellaceae bacterium]|nr:hypothetical protein [Tannerellaceae bacterium]
MMVRYPMYFIHYSFGFYWDSFAHKDEDFFAAGFISRGAYWKNAVNGGEIVYDWGV